MSQLRIAVVGIKGVGAGHARALAANPRTELAAVADIDATAAAQVAAEHQATSYTDYRELLDKERPDAIVCATPHHLHAPMALETLDADVHTFVEKPLAIRVSEGDRMVQAAGAKNLVLAVGHNYRTFPANVKLKQIIDSGQIGTVHRVLWQWLENRTEAYYNRDIWRCTWRHAGGGVLMNQTSHDLDLLCWLVGQPVEVSAMITNQAHQHEVEDTAIANIRFANGALANVQLSTYSHRLNYRQITGDRGAILLQDTHNANVHTAETFRLGIYQESNRDLIAAAPSTDQPVPDWQDIDCSDATSPTLLDSFIDAVLDGGTPITDGASALVTLELINAIILSGLRQQVVTLPIDRDAYDHLMDELISGATKVSRA
jgi:UDP-N-acetyl-2-amino-2-deoxyglucuronate dehydrogenase